MNDPATSPTDDGLDPADTTIVGAIDALFAAGLHLLGPRTILDDDTGEAIDRAVATLDGVIHALRDCAVTSVEMHVAVQATGAQRGWFRDGPVASDER